MWLLDYGDLALGAFVVICTVEETTVVVVLIFMKDASRYFCGALVDTNVDGFP